VYKRWLQLREKVTKDVLNEVRTPNSLSFLEFNDKEVCTNSDLQHQYYILHPTIQDQQNQPKIVSEKPPPISSIGVGEHSGIGNTHSIHRKHSIISIRSIAHSITSKVSQSMSHIDSVIASSASWRSSLIYAGSISSSGVSNANSSRIHLSTVEHHAWNELVEESQFATACPEFEEISLKSRICCRFAPLWTGLEQCKVCGFTETHRLARESNTCSHISDLSLFLDRFGNSQLHHAAAVGNTRRMVYLMSILLSFSLETALEKVSFMS